eukprot:SAG31_NODE_1602_length_7780_cov_8.304699_8_plen_135_part_00
MGRATGLATITLMPILIVLPQVPQRTRAIWACAISSSSRSAGISSSARILHAIEIQRWWMKHSYTRLLVAGRPLKKRRIDGDGAVWIYNARQWWGRARCEQRQATRRGVRKKGWAHTLRQDGESVLLQLPYVED